MHEPGTAVAEQFLLSAAERPWQISSWVETELASALAMQCRRGVIQASERPVAWQRFQELRQARLQLLKLEPMDLEAAARLCLADAPPLPTITWQLNACRSHTALNGGTTASRLMGNSESSHM